MTAPSTAEAGRTQGSEAVHAVCPSPAGPTAVCGAEKVVQRLPGRFGRAAAGACPACVAATS